MNWSDKREPCPWRRFSFRAIAEGAVLSDRAVQYYFGIDVLQACDAVFRGIHTACPDVLHELRALPENPIEGLCECPSEDVVALAAHAERNGGAFHLLTPLTEIALIGHEVRKHSRFASSVERTLMQLLAPSESSESSRQYAVVCGEPITKLPGLLVGRGHNPAPHAVDWLQREWRQILLLSVAGHLSDAEVEMLRAVIHDWPPSAASELSDHRFGILVLLTQRLLHERFGVQRARELGPVPAHSLIDAEIDRAQTLARLGLIAPKETAWAAAVPPEVHEWAVKRLLSTPELESTAALLRCEWRLRTGDPLPLSQAPIERITELTRSIFPARRSRNRRKRPFEPVPPMRHLSEHAVWLVRVQLLGDSPSRIARETRPRRERQAVEHAVHKLADLLDLSLRPLRGGGRPRNRHESARRHLIKK